MLDFLTLWHVEVTEAKHHNRHIKSRAELALNAALSFS